MSTNVSTVNSASIASSQSGILNVDNPLPNPLSNYASYNYILSLAALTKDQANDPDATYMTGSQPNLICKSAGADPNNRVDVNGFGKHDFFITNLELQSMIGFKDGKNTNVFSVNFEVVEPYSVGLFILSCQLAAARSGFPNYHCAPFLLTVEFKGNKENGLMQNVPYTTKFIPIIINSIDIKASESGAVYTVSANVHTSFSQTIIFSKIPHEVSIKGKTVQEALQSLETSLQYIINQNKSNFASKENLTQPDQVLIIFPKKISSLVPGNSNKKDKATVNPSKPDTTSSSIFQKLGTSEQPIKDKVNQIQNNNLNDIASASLLFDLTRKGDASASLYDKVYKEKKLNRASVTVDDSTGTFKFNQGITVEEIINEVILNSSYAVNALKDTGIDSFGNRKWWRIDTQTYYLGDNRENSTNLPATLTVYRVVEYKCHTSILTSPGLKPIGIDKINENVPKVYNYIYSTSSTPGSGEVLKFNIEYNLGWLTTFLADKGNLSQDTETQDQRSSVDTNKNVAQEGIDPSKTSSNLRLGTSVSPSYSYLATIVSGDKGGTTGDTPEIMTARLFQALITNPIEMIGLDMEIMGDPFWISSSGLGNYSADSISDYVNADYSVNWQSGEIYVHVNFRSPIDINQATGLYQFPKMPGAFDSAIMFKGLYRINQVTSRFKDGIFTQSVKGYRVNNQFEDITAKKSETLNNSKIDNTPKTI